MTFICLLFIIRWRFFFFFFFNFRIYIWSVANWMAVNHDDDDNFVLLADECVRVCACLSVVNSRWNTQSFRNNRQTNPIIKLNVRYSIDMILSHKTTIYLINEFLTNELSSLWLFASKMKTKLWTINFCSEPFVRCKLPANAFKYSFKILRKSFSSGSVVFTVHIIAYICFGWILKWKVAWNATNETIRVVCAGACAM